jgi:hypothetical protein
MPTCGPARSRVFSLRGCLTGLASSSLGPDQCPADASVWARPAESGAREVPRSACSPSERLTSRLIIEKPSSQRLRRFSPSASRPLERTVVDTYGATGSTRATCATRRGGPSRSPEHGSAAKPSQGSDWSGPESQPSQVTSGCLIYRPDSRADRPLPRLRPDRRNVTGKNGNPGKNFWDGFVRGSGV